MVWIVWVVGSFVGAVLGHALACRLPLPGNILFRFLVVGGGIGLILASLLWQTYGFGLETWAALLLYAFICELYIFVFTFVASSVSVSLLMILDRQSFKLDEIDQYYSSEGMVEGRLEKLLKVGLITSSPSGYVLTLKSQVLTAIFDPLRQFFKRAPY
ncbi:MAG: hypothetical protein SFW36_05730 [Leptolyngbyaceae cyanobacterium bins.59]|nr:hypothetical protein [Leptolyngbyaceae cyanobacterium bins.59]